MSHHYWHGTLEREKMCIGSDFFNGINAADAHRDFLTLTWLINLVVSGVFGYFWVAKGVNLNRVGSVFLSIGRFWAEIGVQTNRRLRLFSCLQGEN